jgi:hypothetical protein
MLATKFTLEETIHRFQVISLWEEFSDLFMNNPGLLPITVL